MLVQLPTAQGRLAPLDLEAPHALAQPLAREPVRAAAPAAPTPFNRLAYAAAHVVALPAPPAGPPAGPPSGTQSGPPPGPQTGAPTGALPGPLAGSLRDSIDWEATLRYRRHLWSLGLGVAEAMDTAQRELLGWETSAHLLDVTLRAAAERPGCRVIGGAGTDQLASGTPSLTEIIDAYVSQAEFIHARGGRVILFPTALLPRLYPEPRHTVEVYRTVSRHVSRPVFVHWLGEMFAPALKGYFPGQSFWDVMADNPRILGVKLSLLDEAREEGIRRRLAPQGQVVLTGDDFNFPALIQGAPHGPGAAALKSASLKSAALESTALQPAALPVAAFEFEGARYPSGDYSHALLGIFDGIAPVAARALACLARGDTDGYARLLAPTVPLARHIFGEPTRFYKAGLVFLAYLNGHQEHFHLLAGLERERDILHYAELFRLAHAAGVLEDPVSAYERFRPLLDAAGF